MKQDLRKPRPDTAAPPNTSGAPDAMTEDPDLLPEYDFTNGVRGKYASPYTEGSNVVVLAPDVAAVFADSQAVNDALRTLLRLSQSARTPTSTG